MDLAVAPFNTSTDQAPADAQKIRQAAALCPLVKRIEERGKSNNCLFRKNCHNPRCLLAIEIEFTRTSKYMLGDSTNASLMGLIGLVIGRQETVTRLRELGQYMRRVVKVGKLPQVSSRTSCVLNFKNSKVFCALRSSVRCTPAGQCFSYYLGTNLWLAA